MPKIAQMFCAWALMLSNCCCVMRPSCSIASTCSRALSGVIPRIASLIAARFFWCCKFWLLDG